VRRQVAAVLHAVRQGALAFCNRYTVMLSHRESELLMILW
jgi:hypothetical protein